jgi:hypothetical protein
MSNNHSPKKKTARDSTRSQNRQPSPREPSPARTDQELPPQTELPRPQSPTPPTDLQEEEEIYDEIIYFVESDVRAGFKTRDEIVQSVTEFIEHEHEHEVSDVEEQVAEETDHQLEKHLLEQASWPEVTDCDKIDRAFAALEAQGIVARQNFTCTSTSGRAEITGEIMRKLQHDVEHGISNQLVDDIKKFGTIKKPLGYVFYHAQDTEAACEDGELRLAYGTVGGTDEDIVAVGNTIRDTLSKHGLTVEWNGTSDERICIKEIDWKKRREPE